MKILSITDFVFFVILVGKVIILFKLNDVNRSFSSSFSLMTSTPTNLVM
jgi:hypothetical protein